VTAAHQPPIPPATQPPYLVGDRVQILYMSERGTVLADAHVTAVFTRPDGDFAINAVLSDARASFHLVPVDRPATTIRRRPRPARMTYGVDHTRPGD
jgi:hypothetical protein